MMNWGDDRWVSPRPAARRVSRRCRWESRLVTVVAFMLVAVMEIIGLAALAVLLLLLVAATQALLDVVR